MFLLCKQFMKIGGLTSVDLMALTYVSGSESMTCISWSSDFALYLEIICWINIRVSVTQPLTSNVCLNDQYFISLEILP